MLIYDLEILNAIPDRVGPRLDGVAYCEGWHDHAGMGVAVLGCYDYTTDRYRVFCQDNLSDFAQLVERQECLVGFNNNRFDNPVLTAAGVPIPPEKCYDILEEIWRALRLPADGFIPSLHGGYSLEAMCQANFRVAKSASGANAPVLWQQGRIGSVIDYCLNDLRLTKMLLDRIIRCGALANPKDPHITIYPRKPGSRY